MREARHDRSGPAAGEDRGGRLRRVLRVVAGYTVVAALLWGPVDTVARVFFLPPLFGRAARAFLVAGLPLAVAVAWNLDRIGAPPGPEADVRGDSRREG